MKNRRLLMTLLAPIFVMTFVLLWGTKAKAEGYKAFLITNGQNDYTGSISAHIYEYDPNSTDQNIPFIGGSNKYISHMASYSVRLYCPSASSYQALIYPCSADSILTCGKYGDDGYLPYDIDGNRIADSAIINCINNTDFATLSSYYWVKGSVTPKQTLTVEGSLDFTPAAYSPMDYYLPDVILKCNGEVISHGALTPKVELTAADFLQETVVKEISFAWNQVGGYRFDTTPTVTVHIPEHIDLSSTTLSRFISYPNYHYKATGEQVTPDLESDISFSINNNPDTRYFKKINLINGVDYDISYENNIYPTSPASPAAVVLTFKGKYTGEKRESFNIYKDTISDTEASVSISDRTEGDTPSTPVVTCEKFYHEKNEAGDPIFTYYVADTNEAVQGVPTSAGNYIVKAELPEGLIFEGTSVMTTFTITERPYVPPYYPSYYSDPDPIPDPVPVPDPVPEISGNAGGGTAVTETKTEEKNAAGTEPVEVKKEGKKYVNEDGEVVKKSLVKTEDGKVLYVNANGNPSKNALVNVGKDLFITNKKGEVITNKVVTLDNGNKMIAGKDGALVKKSFATTPKGKTVYADKNGVLKTGIFKVHGKTYYGNKSGIIQKNKWITIDGTMYYCNKNGVITKTKDK